MPELVVKPLNASTWPAYVKLIEKHNGVWGGCWCLYFHQKGTGSHEGNREAKHSLMCEGKARAAVVFDGDAAVGWCQYGRPDDLPRIQHKKDYDKVTEQEADWRITCFFVDRDYRRKGVATLALKGALDLIRASGGGLVESLPALSDGQKTSSSFLYNATTSIFEREGFERVGPVGKKHWLVTRRIESVSPSD